MYRDMGYIYSFKSFYEGDDSPIKKPGFYDDYFKGQNLGRYYFNVIAPTVKTERQTVYATAVDESFHVVLPLYLRDMKMTAKAGLDKMIADLKLRAPDATIE